MEPKFDLTTEINNAEKYLINKDQLSTVDLAVIYNLCDKYIKNKLGVDILTIFEKVESPAEDITRYLMMSLYSEPKLLNFLNKFGLSNILAQTIYSSGNKQIVTITAEIIQNSNKHPHQMPRPTDERQIKRIFQALKNNYHLYLQLYKDKIWLINSSDNNGNIIGQGKIKISPFSFFHLMGFDIKNLKPDSLGGIELSKILPNTNEALSRLSNFTKDKPYNIYYIIEELLKSEENFLSSALQGKMSNAVSFKKLEMKSYAFERMGIVQRASGMVFFDKNKVAQQYKKEVEHISSEIILLNDFLRKYEINNLFGLDFVISPYNRKKENGVSDQQSVFLTRQEGGGFNSHLFDNQKASISSSVAGYRENDFKYSIVEKGETGGEILEAHTDPIMENQFSEEDRKRVAQTMIEAIPTLEQTFLDEIVRSKGNKK